MLSLLAGIAPAALDNTKGSRTDKGETVRQRSANPALTRRAFLMTCSAAALSACGVPREPGGALRYAASIHPAAAILTPLIAGRAGVDAIVPRNASPHTYETRPADAAIAESARALFYIADDLDGWAVSLPTAERVALMDFVPESLRHPWPEEAGGHEHGHDGDHHHHDDPHFWSDPLAVAAVLPKIAESLRRLDPGGADGYAAQAAAFEGELAALHEEMTALTESLRGAKVVTFHPSWNYFLYRYGIEPAGYIEPSAGKEITPRDLQALIELARSEGVKAILTEPQLAPRPAQVVSEETGIPVYEIDPLGGADGRMTYPELIRYNAAILREALA